MKIKGLTVTLYEKTQTGVNEFNEPIYTETPVEVNNVLVAPTTSDDIVNEQDLAGRKAGYTLAIPKGDTHNWVNQRVTIWGKDYMTFGEPLQGIEDNIPLAWNKKVTVESIE